MNSNSGLIIRPIVQVYSQRADVKWFLPIATAPDLSWIQSGYQYVKSIPTYQSLRASTVGFLSPPLNVSWATNTYDIVLPRVVLNSTKTDPTGYLSPPIDLSWLILVSNAQEIPKVTYNSFQSNTSSFLPIIGVPDLSWIQSTGTHGIIVPGIPSRYTNTAWFLSIPTPPDLSWLGVGEIVRIPTRLTSSTYAIPLSVITVIQDSLFIIEMNIIPSVDGVIKIQAFPINSSSSVIVKAGSVGFMYDI